MPGQFGDYSIASSRKFFPGVDGGMLLRRSPATIAVALRRAGLIAEAKSLAAAIQIAAEHGRLGTATRPIRFLCRQLDKLSTSQRNSTGRREQPGGGCMTDDVFLNTRQRYLAGRAVSRSLIRLSGKARVAIVRRRNYQRLLAGLSDIAAVQPLFPTLPDDVVPYVFPLLIAAADERFHDLRRRNVPMYRWEDLEPSNCLVSQEYQWRLIQLPCHQELTDSDIEWIISEVRESADLGPR
jgi:hypothetical protein